MLRSCCTASTWAWTRFETESTLLATTAQTAGLDEYATALKLPDGALAAQPRKAFAINAGGGLKVPVDDNWGIRTDARWFNGLGRDAGEHWRLYNGVTFPTGRR